MNLFILCQEVLAYEKGRILPRLARAPVGSGIG